MCVPGSPVLGSSEELRKALAKEMGSFVGEGIYFFFFCPRCINSLDRRFQIFFLEVQTLA